MANSFFQAGILLDVQMQVLHQHVQIASLIAQIHSDSQGIIQDDHRQTQGNGESATGQTFQIANGDDHGNGEGAVRRGHVTVGEKIFPLEAVLDHKNDEFGGLGDDADDHWHKRNQKSVQVDVH